MHRTFEQIYESHKEKLRSRWMRKRVIYFSAMEFGTKPNSTNCMKHSNSDV